MTYEAKTRSEKSGYLKKTRCSNRPAVLPSGSYHPAQLINYFASAAKRGVPDFEMAEHLGVDRHRLIYALGEGRKHFEKRARQHASEIR